jgi:hypothetical protein
MEPYLRLLLSALQAAAIEGGKRLARWVARRLLKDEQEKAELPAFEDEVLSTSGPDLNVLRLANELRDMRDGEAGEL